MLIATVGKGASYAGEHRLNGNGGALFATKNPKEFRSASVSLHAGKIVITVALPANVKGLIDHADLYGSDSPGKPLKGHTLNWNALPHAVLVSHPGSWVSPQIPTELKPAKGGVE